MAIFTSKKVADGANISEMIASSPYASDTLNRKKNCLDTSSSIATLKALSDPIV